MALHTKVGAIVFRMSNDIDDVYDDNVYYQCPGCGWWLQEDSPYWENENWSCPNTGPTAHTVVEWTAKIIKNGWEILDMGNETDVSLGWEITPLF